MKIRTITCHDVYNYGASLQAYALMTYLENQNMDVEIIDYKPDYLNRHYSLTHVNNPRYNIPLIREAYILAKLPGRIKALYSLKKKRFDSFKENYLKTTRRYSSYQELLEDPPAADLYLAGSDQIWNPTFPNGKDPAFYLQFAPEHSVRASYAASFSVEQIDDSLFDQISAMIHTLDYVSVRERSGLQILEKMGKSGIAVCDPVFLIESDYWKTMLPTSSQTDPYCFLYDFDHSYKADSLAESLCRNYHCQLWSAFPAQSQDRLLDDMGPIEFLSAIQNARVVLSNSFHATAFSLIFHKDFYVLRRKEHINTRMEDLLSEVGLSDRLINSPEDLNTAAEINWDDVDQRMSVIIKKSKNYLHTVIQSCI